MVGEAGRRDARRREDDELAAVGGRAATPASRLDLPPTRPKRDDGELVN